MRCPKCDGEFEAVVSEGVVVHRCTECRGLWFDDSKHEFLKSVDGSEKIDIGDPEVGRRFNDMAIVTCPRCHSRMIRMVVPDQHHIWYESCSGCAGVFFDAGEFRDYKDKTLFDYVRDLFTPERR